jgi:hypothetical protein
MMNIVRIRTLLCASLLAACKAEGFACAGVGECMLAGEPGVCVAGNCAYPDAMCPSGYRYAAGLDNGLAGECVAEDAIESSDTDASTGSSESSSSESSSSSTASSTSSTTDPVTASTGSSTTMMTGLTSNVTDTMGTSMTDGMPTTTEIPSECTDLACENCLNCAALETCVEEATSCASQRECTTAVGCLSECLFSGVCLVDCCEMAGAEVAAAALELYNCVLAACPTCMVVGEPTCGMMP